MPCYEFTCPEGHHFEVILPVSDYKVPQRCACGAQGRRIISVPLMVSVQRECRYDSPVTGTAITSWAQRRDDLARHGCQEYDPLMKQDAERFRHHQQAALERTVDDTVDAAVERMDNRQRESLANELNSGADAAVERGSVPSP